MTRQQADELLRDLVGVIGLYLYLSDVMVEMAHDGDEGGARLVAVCSLELLKAAHDLHTQGSRSDWSDEAWSVLRGVEMERGALH